MKSRTCLAGLFAALCLISPAGADETNGLVLQISFDGNALDASGYTNNGVISGATFVAGVHGQALHFNGSTDYVRVKSSDSLRTPTFSVVAWANSEDPLPVLDRAVTGKHREHENISYYWLYQSANEIHGTMVGNTYGAFQHATNSAVPVINQWAHLGLTYDGFLMRLYVNGVEVSSRSVTGYSGNDFDLLIGAGEFSWWSGAPQRFWKGAIDDYGVYNRPLSSNEVFALASGVTNAPPVPGAIRCDLSPAGALDAGAQWRLASEAPGLWHNSGETLSGLAQGSYEVQFGAAPGWVTPASRVVFAGGGTTQVVACAYAMEPLDGLVLRFDFDQIVGGYIPDLSGMSNSGRVLGATALATGGVVGSYARFTATGDYILVKNSSSLVSPNFSVTAWVMSEEPATQAVRGIVGKHKAFDNVSYYWLYQNNGQLIATMVGSSYGNYVLATNSSAPLLYQWAHVAMTYTGSVLRLYVNGVEVSAKTVAGYTGNAYDLLVGAGEWATSGSVPQQWWKGGIDELRIYNRGLSSDEVQALYSGQTNIPVQRGSVRVNLAPSGAAEAGAWRLSTEPSEVWHASGYVVSNVIAGTYPIVFKEALGWAVPSGVSASIVGSSLTTVTGTYAYVSTNDLVLYFDFDEPPAGNILADKSGYGNHGTASNVTYLTNGYRDGCYFFNGSNAFVVVPDDNSYDITSFTICVWAKSTDTNPVTEAGMIGKHREGFNTSYYWVYQGSSNTFGSNVVGATMIGSQSGQFKNLAVPPEPILGQWALVTLTYDEPAMKFYVNGALVATQSVVGYTGNGYHLLVGAGEWKLSNGGVPQRLWNGYLDEVRIYRRALGSNEVSALFNTDVPSDIIPPVILDIMPPDRHVTTESGVTITIRADDNVGVTAVTVNGLPAEEKGGNHWRFRQDDLEYGSNTFTIVASDEQGNAVTQTVVYARGKRLKLEAEADGHWRVTNENEFDIPFAWDVLQASETGTGSVDAASTEAFRTSVGPKAVELTVNEYVQDVRAWNPSPIIGRTVNTNADVPLGGRGPQKFGGGDSTMSDIITWESVPGQTYQVQTTTNMASGIWVDAVNGYYVGDGSIISYTNTVGDDPSFLRIQIDNVFW